MMKGQRFEFGMLAESWHKTVQQEERKTRLQRRIRFSERWKLRSVDLPERRVAGLVR